MRALMVGGVLPGDRHRALYAVLPYRPMIR